MLPGDWRWILNIIHSDFCHEESYAYVLPRDVHAQLRLTARPVKDVKMIPGSDNSYRVKVDGEHGWVFDAGSAWYVCRNDPKLTVVNYIMKKEVSPFKGLTTAFRAEQLIGGDLVLIDVIAVDGIVEPVIRRHDSYVDILQRILLPPCMIVRNEYGTFEEAEDARETDGLFSDGVIIIEKATSITYRIKDPTIDLLFKDRGLYVVRANGTHMFVCKSPFIMKKGGIYECNVRLDGNDDLEVTRAALRTDKVKPNATSVFHTIKQLLRSSDTIDHTLVDRVSSYSFMVRRYMYQWILERGINGRFVIDVGSGRMQSLNVMPKDGTAYLFCDPDLNTKSIRDIGSWVDMTDMDPDSVLATLEQLIRGMKKRAYYRGLAESLFSIHRVCDFMRINKCPVVYSFSLSYVVRLFNNLARIGIKQIGCCYAYDRMGARDVLVDLGGICIARNPDDPKLATARYGEKVSYTEPIVLHSSFPRSDVRSAVELIDDDYEVSADALAKTCRIRLVVSRSTSWKHTRQVIKQQIPE